jgi:hypothetical protein
MANMLHMTVTQTCIVGMIDLLGAVGFGCWYSSWGAGLWMGIVLLKTTQLFLAGLDYYGSKMANGACAKPHC